MLVRRARQESPSFDQRIQDLAKSGFQVLAQPEGCFLVSRGGFQACVRADAQGRPLIEKTARLIGGQAALLVDAGYQKFWQAPGGRREPALAEHLSQLHNFEEDLRQALGIPSLYNTSLGSVNTLHSYDRLQGRP